MTSTEHQTTSADLYLRLSDLRDDDLDDNGHSPLQRKEKLLRDRAAQLGWTVHRVVIENDAMPPSRNGNGKTRPASAFKRRKITTPSGEVKFRVYRPGFRSMLDDIAAGRASAILAEDLDRACRDPRDLEDLIDLMESARADARSLSGSLTFTAGGTDAEITMARVMVAMGNKSSRDTSRRVAQARKSRAEAGRNGGGRRPYGFQADGVTVNPAEAAEIRKAAAAVLAEGDDKTSLKAHARSMRDRKVPSVTGAPWSAETLRDVLLRPRNAGIAVYQGQPIQVPDGKQPPWMRHPILDEQTWRDVVTTLTDPARRTGTGNAPRWLGSGIYLCGACDDGTTVQVGGGRPAHPGYICKRVSHMRRNAVALDAWVGLYLTKRLARSDAVNLLRPAANGIDRGALRDALGTHETRLLQIAADYDNDDITREQMLTQTASRRKKIAAVNARLAAASAGPDVLDGIAGNPDAAKIWPGLGLERQRAILVRLATVTLLPGAKMGRQPGGLDTASVRIEPKR